ncbi:MAG: hypothetical protein ACOYL6_13170 [Bacteriovoracaceae bacterium]
MTQAKVVRMSGYLYLAKGKKKSFKLVSPIEDVVELSVKEKDVNVCQGLIWEEVDVIGEQEGKVIHLISIALRSRPLAG